jgi:hypothetical protein
MVEERKDAEYAILIHVSYPRRLPSAEREPVGGARQPARMSW